jgi:hypothetical protein
MSDPVKSDGIEDVLSSIRRLVSEDTRGAAVPQAASEVQAKPEALVLTPALRVAGGDRADAAPKHASVLEPAGLDPADESEPEAGLQFVRAPEPAPAAEPAEAEAEAAAVDTDAPWRKPETTLFQAAGGVSEQAVSSSSLKEKIAALEAVIGGTPDQWEPDGDSSDAYAGTNVETMVWEDHAEAAPEAAPEPEEEALDAVFLAEEAVTEEALDALASDEAVLDEASLRELVADIVREELQGALGERITRNVRKLVRREIHRALAAQELG